MIAGACQARPATRGMVLLVNPNAGAREQIAGVLDASGFEVWRCDTVAAARRQLLELDPVAMVIDYAIGEHSGFSLVRDCRVRGRPVVAIMTAEHAGIDAAVRAMRVGVNDFLAAPFDRRVAQAVTRALRADD